MINIVLGSMNFGGSADLALSSEIVDVAHEQGITAIDTANAYTEGRSEEFLGAIIKERPGRFEIASKVGNPDGPRLGSGPLSAESITASVNTSLERLGLDSLDLLYFHQPDRSTPFEESLAAVEKLRQTGKVKRLGLSNYSSWQIEQIAEHSRQNGYLVPSISQQRYSLLARRLESEYAEYAQNTGLETIVYNPLAGGLLAKEVDPTATPESGRFGNSAQGKSYRERYWNQEQFDTISQLRTIAQDAGLSLLELSLRWLLNRPLVNSVLLGPSRPDQIAPSIAAFKAGPLPVELDAACNEATDGLLGIAPNYNR
ncbi:MAG: aldo/keto reductase [Microbacteriaceae bacterium]